MAKMGPGKRQTYEKPQNTKKTVFQLLHYVGRYKLSMVLVIVFLLVNTACTVGGSYLLKPATGRILAGDFAGLAQVLMLMAGVYVTGALCSFAYSRIMVHISQKTVYTIRKDLFEKMQSLPIRYFDRHTHGELMSRYTNDIDTISEMINNSIGSLISSALTFVGIMAMMLFLSWRLTLITVAVLVVMLLVVRGIGSRSRYFFAEQQKDIGAVNGYIEEMIEGQKVIKVFNHEEKAKEGFYGINETYRKSSTAAQTFAGAMMPAMGNISHINYALTCCIGGLFAINGMFYIDTLVAGDEAWARDYGLTGEALERQRLVGAYHFYLGGLVEKYGISRVIDLYDGTTDVSELANVRTAKRSYCELMLEDSPLLSRLFGLELGDMRYRTWNYDVENDFYGIYVLCGLVGLGLLSAFFLYFFLLIVKALLRNAKKYYTSEAGAWGVALVMAMLHAFATAGILRRPNASFYLSVVLAVIYYLVKLRRYEETKTQAGKFPAGTYRKDASQ